MRAISRRDFLAGSVSTCLLTACSAPSHKNQYPVVIVGAGLAGLAAAYELQQKNVNFLLLEQDQLAGGRVRTVRDRFSDRWIDVGAMTAGGSYQNLIRYCDTFGLKRVSPSSTGDRPDALLLLRDKRLRQSELTQLPEQWPLELLDTEKGLAPFRLLSHYLKSTATEIGSPASVLDLKFKKYDDLSLLDFLKEKGASDGAIRLIDHTLNYNSLDTVSSLSALRDVTRLFAETGPGFHIEGGNGNLPEAMAKAMDSAIEYNSHVEAVETSDRGVVVKFSQQGLQQTVSCDRLIVTLPFTALRKISFSPVLPASRRQMIDSLPYTQVAKTFVETRSRFWEQDFKLSAVYSDSEFERVFNLSDGSQNGKGMLLNWINGRGLAEFSQLTASQHEQRVVAWMQSVWPEHQQEFQNALTFNWRHTYAEGAYAHYAPGQLRAFATEIPKPIGPLHFAGEHTQLVEPGMEGALTSGVRAANEVMTALNA